MVASGNPTDSPSDAETISPDASVKQEDGPKHPSSRRKILLQAATSLSGDVERYYIEAKAPDLSIELVAGLTDVGERLAAGGYECLIWRVHPADSPDLVSLRNCTQGKADLPIVVVVDVCDAGLIRAADELGISAIVPTWSSGELLIGILRLVLAGGIYRPYERQRSASGTPNNTAMPPMMAVGSSDRGVGTRSESGERSLTRRQGDVWRLLAEGKSNKNIAAELGMRESTVKVHIKQIMKKLQVENRTQAALLAVRSGIVGGPSLRPR